MGPRVHGWMGRASRLMKGVEDAMLAVLLGAMIFIGGWQIIMRNLVGVSLSWADESQRLLLLWLALLGAMAASRDRKQLRIDLASRYLRGLPRHALEAFADLLTAAVAAVIGWFALSFVRETWAFGDLLLEAGGLEQPCLILVGDETCLDENRGHARADHHPEGRLLHTPVA